MHLAIDPGTACGIARWSRDGGFSAKVVDLSAHSQGATFARTRSVLRSEIMGASSIVLEAPVLPDGVSIQSRTMLFGIRAYVLELAHTSGVSLVEVNSQQWRKDVLGVARAPKGTDDSRAWLKARCVLEMEKRGHGFLPVDAAEALAILYWHLKKRKIDVS